MAVKVCKKDKLIVKGDICPICKKNSFTSNFQGRIAFLDKDKSFIAKEMDIHQNGEYAIKLRG